MEYRKFGSKIVARIDKGEEIIQKLKLICMENEIKLGYINAIGAVGEATIGLFETSTKKYLSTTLKGDFEITSLIGNISTMNSETYLHLHVNLSDEEYKTYGGHLNSAVVSGTCELIIECIDGTVEREFNDEIGLNLMKF